MYHDLLEPLNQVVLEPFKQMLGETPRDASGVKLLTGLAVLDPTKTSPGTFAISTAPLVITNPAYK
jgi:hypothetical protein